MSEAGIEVAPTLVASRTALPPEGAELRLGRPCASFVAPTLVASRTALPPEGAELRLGRPGASFIAPTLAASRTALPPEGAGLAWGGPALRPLAPTLVASRPLLPRRIRNRGFTLIELLVVVAIMAIATAGVGMALRDNSGTALEREAQRLAVLLESARAQSRMTGNPVRWRPTASGFLFEGLPTASAFPSAWLGQDVRVAGANAVVLGPEPVIGPQQIRLVSISQPSRSLTLASDGVRPFAVLTEGASLPGTR